ncbi:MAG: hypothetical protein ABSD44_13180 [Terracidiphilus sp.]
MIRQAVSCDICGMEKKQTNHWFVAYSQGGELRVSAWNSRNRMRPESKHLCGQTCLHKLVDEFMARALTARLPQAADNHAADAARDARNEVVVQAVDTDTSLTSGTAWRENESSARLIAAPVRVAPARLKVAPAPAATAAPVPASTPLRLPIELVVVPARPCVDEDAAAANEPPRYASRSWRAAAWERERERELRAGERRPGLAHRRLGS